MNAMTIHLAASIPNFHILETIAVDVPWRKEIVRETLEFTAGEIIVPTKPGLGVELDESACARHPHKPHDVPFFDGRLNVDPHKDYQPFVGPAGASSRPSDVPPQS